MKTLKKIVSVALVFAMAASLAACGKKAEETKKKKKKRTKKTTIEETTKESTQLSAPDISITDPTDTEPTDTDPTTAPSGLNIQVPEKDCLIDIPTDPRYHYDMDLTLDTKENTVSGHVVVQFFNNSDDDWDELCLRDYSSLFKDDQTSGIRGSNGALTEITNIVDNRGNKSIEYKRDDDVSVVWFPLETPLKAHEEMTLSYDFTAKIPSLADRYGVSDGVYNVTNFYPILAVYTDGAWSHEAFYNMGECFFSEIADFNVRLTVPSEYMILSTGIETNAQEKDGNTIYTIVAPCVRDFVFCACASFKLVEGYYRDVHIRVVYDEAHPASTEMDACAAASLEAAQDSLAAFGEAFGQYPYAELDIILAPIDAGGMEYPNLIICTAESYYCTKYDWDLIPYQTMCVVVAHEIGHQWFMGIVGSNSGMEPWLDESFASYTEIVYEEYKGLDDAFEYYSRKFNNLGDPAYSDQLRRDGQLPLNRSYYSFSTTNAYVFAAYETGKAALFQMEEILGREEFHGIIREYVHRNAFTNSTAERFFEVLFEAAGQDNKDLNDLVNAVFER